VGRGVRTHRIKKVRETQQHKRKNEDFGGVKLGGERKMGTKRAAIGGKTLGEGPTVGLMKKKDKKRSNEANTRVV